MWASDLVGHMAFSAETGLFRPKMAVSAENNSFGRLTVRGKYCRNISAVITAVIFGEIRAETVSALLASFGHTAEIEFSAETAVFGRKKACFGQNL